MKEQQAQALKERQQLSRTYRTNKAAQFKAAFEAEPRLKEFDDQIRRCGIEDAFDMIELCGKHHDEWLRNTANETQALALEIVSRHIVNIRMRNSLPPFDDPLPWDTDDVDVYRICRRILTT